MSWNPRMLEHRKSKWWKTIRNFGMLNIDSSSFEQFKRRTTEQSQIELSKSNFELWTIEHRKSKHQNWIFVNSETRTINFLEIEHAHTEHLKLTIRRWDLEKRKYEILKMKAQTSDIGTPSIGIYTFEHLTCLVSELVQLKFNNTDIIFWKSGIRGS